MDDIINFGKILKHIIFYHVKRQGNEMAIIWKAAQTLNPIATNAATTFSLLHSLGQPPAQPPDSHQPPAQPLRNQTATNPASCVASVQPCATRQPQPPTQPPVQPTCAATSLLRSPTQSESHQHSLCPCSPAPVPCSPVPCTALCSLVQPSPAPIREIQPRLVMADSLKEVVPAHMVPVPSPVPVSLSHSQPAQRVTSVLLNGKNFHAWSRSFQLYLGGKRKTRWILEKEPKPAESDPKFDEWVSDNCIILGWMFNSMEDRVYHMFMYHDTVHGLWTALTQILDGRNLAQYEPLSDFPSDGAVESKRLDRRHTYQFLMGLKSEFETLRTQILNTSPCLPYMRRLLLLMVMSGGVVFYHLFHYPSPLLFVPDQRAFAAASGTHLYCQHCRKPGHLIDRYWVLHPELKQQFSRPRGVVVGVDAVGGELQIAQLQSHLGLATASQSSGPTAAIVAETPTALHGPDFEEDFWQGESTRTKLDDKAVRCIFLGYSSMSKGYRCYDPVTRHMYHSLDVTFLETVPFFSNSTPNPRSEILAADEPIPPRLLPILEPTSPTSTPSGSLSPIASQDPGPRAQAPLPASSPESGMSSPFISDIPPTSVSHTCSSSPLPLSFSQ
ncbi:hypothetical protein Acr_12g0001280 [Actinidia rufa]|uniref:Retrotransposon Copia-like N-terminal domain-containing protein n=1 Tax=Actinidia rufa TaxID=165716 RepID=A0A7J0FI61_9ERIC|nr:hypothetical protein Acr_12g0001280 [Actinidia rufa]